MKKLLFFIVLLSSYQMFAAEGDDLGMQLALPADDAAAATLEQVEYLELTVLRGRRRKSLQYLVKVNGDNDSYLCTHPSCQMVIKLKNRDSAIKHDKDHRAKDSQKFPCERGCSDQFFGRDVQRQQHYKKVHRCVQLKHKDKPDLSSFVGRKVKRFACIYTFCSQHGELFSREDMVSHCQEEHGMEEQDIELDDLLIKK